MGHEEQVALIRLHRRLDPLPAGHVQVVGGLVQNEQIDLLIHEHAKAQAALLPAGKGGDRLEYVLPPEVERSQPVAGGLGAAVLIINHGVHQVALRVGKLDDLRQIADPDRGPHAQPAAVRLLFPQDDLDKRGFSGPVVPQQGDALAPHYLQIHMLEQSAPVKGFFEVLNGEHLIPPELPLPKFDVQAAFLGGSVGGTQALDALFHGKGPLVELVRPHEGPQVELVRRFLELFDLGLLLLVLLQPLLIAALLLFYVKAVVPLVELRLAVLDLNDPSDHPVQKPAVV